MIFLQFALIDVCFILSNASSLQRGGPRPLRGSLHDWLLLYILTSSIGHATLAASCLFMPHKVFQSQCELALLVGSERPKKEEKFDAYRHCRVCVWASAYCSNPRCGEGISFFAISPTLINLVLTYIFHLAIASPNTLRTVKNLHDLRLSEEIALK